IGIAQCPCANACVTQGYSEPARELPEACGLFEVTTEQREMLLGADGIATIEAGLHLSLMSERETRGAALALGQVEYLIGKRSGAGSIARSVSCGPNAEHLYDQLREVAAFFG